MEDFLAPALKFSACLEIRQNVQTGSQERLTSCAIPHAMATRFHIKMKLRILTPDKIKNSKIEK